MKIRPVEAELFHADGRTDMTKLIVCFRNFVKATNKRFLKDPRLQMTFFISTSAVSLVT